MKAPNTTQTLLRYAGTLTLLTACYIAFALAASMLPGNKITQHVARSVEKGDLQEDYPRALVQAKQAQMDNFTDALILNQACRGSRDSLLSSMLLLPRADYGLADQTASLRHMLQDTEGMQTVTYPRYWHGSTFLMRLMLTVFDYPAIRLILYCLSTLLLLTLLLTLWKTDGALAPAAVTAAFLLLYGYVMQFSIQLFPALALALAGSIGICRRQHDARKAALFLFVIGSLTAYFDLLTVPLLTLGLPLTLYCYLMGRQRRHAPAPASTETSERTVPASTTAADSREVARMAESGKETTNTAGRDAANTAAIGKEVAHIAAAGLAWAAGWGLTWLCKWLIATVATPENVLRDALTKASERAGAQSVNVWELADFSRWHAVTSNIRMLPYKPITVIIAALLLAALVRFNRKGWKTSLLLLALSLLPYAWYFAMANHSYQHWWFTYRAQMFSVLAWLLAAANMVDWQRMPRRHAPAHPASPTR